MALNVFTQFAPQGLRVLYRGSTDRQKLLVSFSLPTPFIGGDGAIAAELLERIANEGGVGADVFDPQTGYAKLLSGDRYPDAVTEGPHWNFEFEVAGIAPTFIRTIIEMFSRAGGVVHRLTSLEIRGELPLDRTPMSVDTPTALGWLADPLAYPAAWSKLPFAVKHIEAPSGLSLRVTPAGPTSADLQNKMMLFYQGWGELVTGTMWAVGGGPGMMTIAPKMGRSKKVITVACDEFTYEPKPARDALLNLLVGFHHRVAPLLEVELAFPK